MRQGPGALSSRGRLEVGKEAEGKLRAEVSLPVDDGLCCSFLALTLDIMNSAVKHLKQV